MLQYMRLNKSQSSFEFIILTGLVMVFLVLILSLIFNRTQDFEQTKVEKYSQAVLGNIEKEFDLARILPSGYTRHFTLPLEFEDMIFDYQIIKGKILLIITNQEFQYLSFLSQTIYGEIGPGENKLMKRGNSLGVCYEEFENFCGSSAENTTNKKCYCYDVFPSGTNGTLHCRQEEVWLDCPFDYGDEYDGIRMECSGNALPPVNVTLQIRHKGNILIDSYTVEKDLIDPESFIFNLPENLVINKSGDWEVDYECHSIIDDKSFFNNFYVPYGYYQIFPIGILSPDCTPISSHNYTCKENKTFQITYRVTCVGGECGNSTFWLDP
jgi:hypothetical protein